jgi:hypothetical protein
MRTFILCVIWFLVGGMWGAFFMSLFSEKSYEKGYKDGARIYEKFWNGWD